VSAGSKSGDGTSGQFQVKGALSPTNRDEIIVRCKAKVATRSIPPPTEAQTDHGVPVFLNQLQEALRLGQITSPEIGKSAIKHGHDLLLQGFTVSHDARPSRQERDESRIVAPDGPNQVWRVGDEQQIGLVPVGFQNSREIRDTDGLLDAVVLDEQHPHDVLR
jgi:hypothetical protein